MLRVTTISSQVGKEDDTSDEQNSGSSLTANETTCPFSAKKIFCYLARLGFGAGHTGTKYLSEIIAMICCGRFDIMASLSKGAYPACAEMNGTTPACVERCIRTAIKKRNCLQSCCDESVQKCLALTSGNKEVICYLANTLMLGK